MNLCIEKNTWDSDWRKSMSLAVRIGRLRRRKDESLQDVADAVGVSKAHIWELEKGRAQNPSFGLITRLADHFGVSLAYLVGEDVESPDADRDLQRMFRQAAKLDKREREILNDMMQALLKRQTRRLQ
jgi:transcriptional regulator with XRE-family HTH domain